MMTQAVMNHVFSVPVLGVLGGSLLIALAIAAFLLIISLIISLIMVHVGPKMMEKDERRTADEIKKLLPGTDCGRCAYDNCDQFARACAASNRLMGNCVEGGPEVNEAVRDFLRPELPDQFGDRRVNRSIRAMNAEQDVFYREDREKEDASRKKRDPLKQNEAGRPYMEDEPW